MNNVFQTATAATINIGPPAVIVIVSPYMFYLLTSVFLFTCATMCFSIIGKCRERTKRLDAMMTRKARREYAKRSGGYS